MNFFNPSLKYGISETPILKKIKEKKAGEETEQTNKTENIPEIDTRQTKVVDANALDIIARMNLATVDGLTANKKTIMDGAIDPGGYPAISELEALMNQWYAENENLSYDEKINLLTRIIDLLDENSETFEADNRKWRTIRHTVFVQHNYEYYQGILDDPTFDPETFDWTTYTSHADTNFPDETSVYELYENGEQYGLPGTIVWAVGSDLIYTYHEQALLDEYTVTMLRYCISFMQIGIQRPGLSEEDRARLQELIDQYQEALENNIRYLQNSTIGCEYEDRVDYWEANSSNMTRSEKIALLNEILDLLSQMVQDAPVVAAIAHWTNVKNSVLNSAPQQYEALR